MKWDQVGQVGHGISTALLGCVLLNFLVTVKAAPHEYVIRSNTRVKAENEVWYLFIV